MQAGLDGGSFRYPAACFVTGLIEDRVVPCLSIEHQINFHSGFEPRDVDLADLQILAELRRRQGDGQPRSERTTLLR